MGGLVEFRAHRHAAGDSIATSSACSIRTAKIIIGDGGSWRVIGDELFAVNLEKPPEQMRQHLELVISFYCRFVTLTPDTERGTPECMLSSRKCWWLSSARLPWRRSCMQACILASTLQVFGRKCPLDERTRLRDPGASPHLSSSGCT